MVAKKEALDIAGKIFIPFNEFDFRFALSSGPGGQNVNKTQSKAVLYWSAGSTASLPEDVRLRFMARYSKRLTTEGVLVLASDRFRDQKRNIEDCLERVQAMIISVLTPPKPRKATKPTKGSKERRLQGKRHAAEKKQMRQKPSF